MTIREVAHKLPDLKEEFRHELVNIADWWLKYSFDEINGGFFGEIAQDNTPSSTAPKGVVFHSRILWFFSSLAITIDNTKYREAADYAYEYLREFFLDQDHGGFYWSLTFAGRPQDNKKQVYAQAFAIYALSAYYQISRRQEALDLAMETFSLVERHTVDNTHGGYFEAFARDWSALDDVRLSDKDLNYPKSMNTHLHVLEAYTELYGVASTKEVKKALCGIIECFDKHIIDHARGHLRMFMDESWNDFSPGYTYGHDIEFSWLLSKSLAALKDPVCTEKLQPRVLQLADVCGREATGKHGELFDYFDFASNERKAERVWWVQAEALVGYLTAYVISGESRYFTLATDVWESIKRYQVDRTGGEWLWLSVLDEQPASPHYKAGFWKGPYHNGRAMMEALKILSAI